MARKKRRQSSATQEPAGESAKVRQAVQELRKHYQLGLKVLEADEENPKKGAYNFGVSVTLAEQLGVKRDYVDKARQFASSYTEKQLEELCALRRPDSMPLGRRHLVALLSVKDKSERRRLQRRAAKEAWGYRRLGEEIGVLLGSRSAAGRRPRGPDSVDNALGQIIKMSEGWVRWCEGLEREEDETTGVSLADLPKQVRVRMSAVTDEIRKLEQTAQRHLNTS